MRQIFSIVLVFLIFIGGLTTYTTVGAATSNNNDLKDVVRNSNGIFIAVGEKGTILRSTDGKKWSRASSKAKQDLQAAAAVDKNIVVVGDNGSLLHSTDGVRWSVSKVNIAYKFSDVCTNSSYRKEAVKKYHVNLNQKFTQQSVSLKDVIWDGKQYVAPGYMRQSFGKKFYASSSVVATSKDGKNWSMKLIPSPNENKYEPIGEIKAIAYSGKKYVIVTNASPISSSDLKNWSFQRRGTIRGDLSDIAYNGKTFVAVGWDGSIGIGGKKSRMTGIVYTSTNGTTWREVKTNKDFGITDMAWGKKNLDWNGFAYISIGSIVWDGQKFLAGCQFGMILSSPDGTNWTISSYGGRDVSFNPMLYKKYRGLDADLNKVLRNGDDYIAVGNLNTILYCNDGSDWSIAY
jgi:hypothetical protein